MTGNLAEVIVATAKARPDLRIGILGDELRLDDALALAAGRAVEMLDSGLSPGDRVAMIAHNSTDYIVTWLGSLLAGTPVALVNPTYPAALIEEMLDPLVPQVVMDHHAIMGSRTTDRQSSERGLPGLTVSPHAVVSYMHTSGTSGLPKFCAQSGSYFLRLARVMANVLELDRVDRVLAPLPLYHVNPLGYGVIPALLAGADALTVRRFSASSFWPDVVGAGVSVCILHAPPVEILKRRTTPDAAAGHRIRAMFYADAEFQRAFGIPKAVSAYGSTELGGVSHLTCWSTAGEISPDAGRHGGKVREDLEWRLRPDGTILVRELEPGAMFDGYVVPGGIDSARDADGWFDTGDLGLDDGEGGLVFLERQSESIRVKGEFVPIPFVEGRLTKVDGLDDYAVWKRSSEMVDEEVVAYVVAPAIPVESIRREVADLPTFMRPVAVARVESLPRDAAAGKVQRRRLHEQPVLEWAVL